MRQFGAIFSFELSKFFKNRTYLIVTAILLTVALAATFVPRVIALFRGGSGGEAPAEGETMLVAGLDLTEELALWFPDYTLQYCDEAELKEKVASGEAACGVVVKAEDEFTYYVENLSLYDENAATLEEAMRERLRTARLTALGLSPEESGEILYPALTSEVVSLGVDQRMNFAYTYIMIIALYMVILLYGQMVATNVAGEKSSRAMELLITTADPVAMMFGKVMASGLAGLVQLLAAFGAALFGYGFNREAWLGLTFGESFFDIPPALLGYMLFFFLTGFLLYAFLYAAVGSTVSRLEDVGNACQPITLAFVAMYLLVIIALSSGNVDTPLMVVCSLIPITSPMAMFTRIAMSAVPLWQQILSAALLVAGVAAAGLLAARIYRVGVLLYGKRPSLPEILKTVFSAEK